MYEIKLNVASLEIYFLFGRFASINRDVSFESDVNLSSQSPCLNTNYVENEIEFICCVAHVIANTYNAH